VWGEDILLTLPLGTSGQTVIFTDRILDYFSLHRQINTVQPEAGGQLFAVISGSEIHITDITGSRNTDTRHRFQYVPDRKLEQVEINSRFGSGLHYVGDWHTHPESTGTPSSRDLQSMRECVRKSSHQLNGFLLVIVGNATVPVGLHVSLHSGFEVAVLLGG